MQRRRNERAVIGNPLSHKHRNAKGNKPKLSTLLLVAAVLVPALATLLIWIAAFSKTANTISQERAKQSKGATVQTTTAKNEHGAGEPVAREALAAERTKGDEVEYHIIFSTGCSTFQDWQSYVFFYYALISQQPGTVTRIVSGCNDKDAEILSDIFQKQIQPMAPTRFKLHHTPDFSTVKAGHSFKYFNKPFGTKHWLEHVLGFPDTRVHEDAIVILLDPDQIILRPFTNNNFSNTQWTNVDGVPRTKVEHGKPMGQLYGFDLQWKHKIDMKRVTTEKSPIVDMSDKEARAGYVVGPPYVATAKDMYQIVTKWCEFAVPVHDQYPYLLAEMFAYCLGAAHLKLAHQTALSFMVSDVGSNREGWNYVDPIDANDICKPQHPDKLPNVLHFCQRYHLGPFFFGKYRFPKDFLSCDSPLLAEPPDDIELKYDHAIVPDGPRLELKGRERRRHAFMVCQLIHALNKAATHFKSENCNGTANYEKTFTFVKS